MLAMGVNRLTRGRVTKSQTPIAKTLGIDGYACPNLDQNPWCPKAPGEHGYMFVGLGKDHKIYKEEKIQPVFIGRKAKKNSKLAMTYVGTYSCKNAKRLTRREWHSLSPEASVLLHPVPDDGSNS